MGHKILLIEDEPHIVEAISFLLEREGMTVITHPTGQDAAQTAASLQPDLVVLDVMLPNKSGFEILAEIRDHPAINATPVLMLTAKGQAKDRAAAEAAGVSRFMTKPFSNKEIVRTVQDLLP